MDVVAIVVVDGAGEHLCEFMGFIISATGA
jgi:hypothetical protein